MEAVYEEEPGVQAMATGCGPRLRARNVYSTSVFNFFSKKRVKKTSFEVTWNDVAVRLYQIPLFSEREIKKMKNGGKYTHIHFGCFRICCVPFFHRGLNAPLRVGLFDTKHSNLPDALAGCYRGNLGLGMQHKDIYRDVLMPLDDAGCWNVLVSLADIGMVAGSIPCTVVIGGIYCLTTTDSHPPLKETIARQLSMKNIPVIETPEGGVVVKFTSNSDPTSLSHRVCIQKPNEEAGEQEKNENIVRSSQDEN